jgi:hypothetical protein
MIFIGRIKVCVISKIISRKIPTNISAICVICGKYFQPQQAQKNFNT